MKLLYVLDDGLSGISDLEHVVLQARSCMADLVLLDVIDTPSSFDDMQRAQQPPTQLKNSLLRERLARLESFVLMTCGDAGEMRARVLFGNRAREICRTAAEGAIDLVIKRREPGTTDRMLVQQCPCPVLLYESHTQLAADNILAILSHPLLREKKAVA